MKKILCVFLLALVGATRLCADEGMWVMGNISEKTDSILRSMGLELSADELYSTEHPSLNDAVVQLGGFCSGVVVSADGLIFTNHHCGFSSVQDHSSPKHDYLRNGFYAKQLSDELPNEGLYVLFHIKTVDVTDLVLRDVPANASSDLRDRIVDAAARRLTELVNCSGRGVESEVNAFYRGSRYFLSVYQRYDDVRLVYAPPQCLGKYGGDTDNWMWPRQTCDFSVFRIYADCGNEPAEYSRDNVPYHPRRHATISTEGYRDGSYAMTLGYPGSTDRYLSSYGIENTMRTVNDVRYQVRGLKLDILREAMQKSDALRIMYASKYAGCSNYWKFSLGQNQALDNLRVVDEKRELERQLNDWARQDTVRRKRYVGVTDSLRNIYRDERDAHYARILWMESFYNGSDILSFAIRNVMRSYEGEEFIKQMRKRYRDIDVETDKKVFLSALTNYLAHVPAGQFDLHALRHEVDSAWNGDYSRYVAHLYATSAFANPDSLEASGGMKALDDDPMVSLVLDVILPPLYNWQAFAFREDEYERLLGDGIRQMNKEKEYYPDANFTMRLSYGLCRPIEFEPGVTGLKEEATAMTTSPRSFLNKHEQNPDNRDYYLIPSVYKWMKRGHFSPRYIDSSTEHLPLCFLTTNDITGGNSGSGVFDGKGRLIGLAFDGNWEAMSGDLKFDNALQRCISVDIRWVLAVMDNYSHAKRLMRELTIE